MHQVPAERSIELVGEINADAVKGITARLRELVEKDREGWINFFISSPGGDGNLGFAICDLVQFLKPKLQTIALGRADSTGVVVFLAGECRVVGPSTTMFLHDVGIELKKEARFTFLQLKTQVQKSEATRRRYCDIIAERTGGKVSAERALELMQAETTLDAEAAVELGFAHEILR
ncbi:MAG: ATP-dependent Clp protease proteolytic subunit [Candidatus Liptonbacteria bacterium]|nr:ATP-dependent Clp protease proteolytic subunit [Candidatus Liptonbacteria bacterium]